MPEAVPKLSGQATCESTFERAFSNPSSSDVFPVLLFVVADVEAPLEKYAMRHYRTMHVDAGVLVQNLYLVTEAMGLAGCAIAGFTDARVASLLNLATTQLPVMAFALGRRS